MTIGAELGQYFVHIQKNSKASMGELNSPNSPTPGYATVRDIPKKLPCNSSSELFHCWNVLSIHSHTWGLVSTKL